MKDSLTKDDIEESTKDKIYVQDYTPQASIEGVKIIQLKSMIGDEGDFSELLRINAQGELESVPGFKIAQINRTQLFPNSVKAWHIHFQQDEMWYVPPQFQLFVGLWDLRKESPTKNATMRINLGGGKSQHLFIPKGVAHGSANFSPVAINLYYFVNQQFDIQNPDERRIHWDSLGKEFWTPEKD